MEYKIHDMGTGYAFIDGHGHTIIIVYGENSRNTIKSILS